MFLLYIKRFSALDLHPVFQHPAGVAAWRQNFMHGPAIRGRRIF